MAEFTINRETTALLIADFYAEAMGNLPHAVERGVVVRTVALQEAAREAGLMVCYCATVFRPGYPEISDRNKTFSARKSSGQPAVFDPVSLILPDVRPRDDEVVVGKHRVNALFGTGLDVALTGEQYRHHHPAGIRDQRGRAVHHPVCRRPRLSACTSSRTAAPTASRTCTIF